MAILTMVNIMEAEDITETTVPVPEWGGEVVVRSVSYRKMGKIKAAVSDSRNGATVDDADVEVEKGLLVAGLVQPSISEEEADMLMEKSANAVMTVLAAIMGNSKADKDSVKEEEKSLPAGPADVLPIRPSGEDAHDSAATPDGSAGTTEPR